MLRRIFVLTLLLCAVAGAAYAVPTASAPSGVRVHLKESAAIRSGRILLGDVAEIRGASPARSDRLAEIDLGPAPQFGSATVLSRSQVLERILKASGAGTAIDLTGAPAVMVRVQGQPVQAGAIEPLVKAWFLNQTAWRDSEVEVRALGGIKGIELPPGRVEYRFASEPNLTGGRKILLPLEAVDADKVLRSFWVTAEIAVRAPVLVASRRIPFGKTVAPGDFQEKVVEISDFRAAYGRAADELAGKIARRTFPPGDPLPLSAFSEPPLVRNGETVQLRLERDGIVLRAAGRAEQDGRLGDVIRVRNLEFSNVVKAEVTGRAAVTIH